MRRACLLVLIVQAIVVIAFSAAVTAGIIPLGVPGEWEWGRVPSTIAGAALSDGALGLLAVAGFVGIAWLGMSLLKDSPSRARESLALMSLFAASVIVQFLVQSAAPQSFNLCKWAVASYDRGSSGYFVYARKLVKDPWQFVAAYPTWIRDQDSLHIGTHPPGLIIAEHALRVIFRANPEAARILVDHLPASTLVGFREIAKYVTLSYADRAALGATGILTLLACAGTVIPLYFLTRRERSAAEAWSAAALWPLIPSAILFQPLSDTAFPFFSTFALVLTAYSLRNSALGLPFAAGAGLILGSGMFFSLVFAPVGLIAVILLAAESSIRLRRRALLITALGVASLIPALVFWAATKANPFVIWWWNQRNHARFYVEFPRSYILWVLVDPVELAVALGLPVSIWAAIGLGAPRKAPLVSWITLGVLALLALLGRNLSEVARLWLPMMPALILAAGRGMNRLGAGAKTLAATVALVAFQTLLLQSVIQTVYPGSSKSRSALPAAVRQAAAAVVAIADR
jgi:hypothetical protein